MTSKASPAPKPPRRRRCWPWAAGASVLSFLTALGLGLYLQTALAPLLENTIRNYAADYGIAGLRFDLHQVTPWQAAIHTLRLSGADPEAGDPFRLDSLVIQYSPRGLKTRVIKGVKLSGLVLRVEKTDAGWRLPGLPDRPSDQAAYPMQGADRPERPDWKIRRLEIRNSRLEIDHGPRRFTVPFSLTIDHDAEDGRGYRGRLKCEPMDQPISVAFELKPDEKALTIALVEADLDLSRLGAFLGDRPAAPLSGRLAAAGKARLQIDPLKVKTAEFQVRLPDGVASIGSSWEVRVPAPESPLATIKRAEDRSWTLHAPEFAFGPAEHVRIRNWRGRLHPDVKDWLTQGALELEVRTPDPDAASTAEASPGQNLPLRYAGRWSAEKGWTFKVSGEGPSWQWHPKPAAETGPLHFTPRLDLTASGAKDQIQFQTNAQLTDFSVQRSQTRVRIPAVSLQASAEGHWHQLQGRYIFKADGLRISNESVQGRLPRVAVAGGFHTAGDDLRLTGRARISRGAVRIPKDGLSMEGIRLDLPLAWPQDPATAGGRFSLTTLKWNDLSLGAVSGRVRQQARGADFAATHQSALLPGARLAVDGHVALATGETIPRVSLAYRLERAASREDIDLGALKADWAGIRGNGRITAAGHGVYEPGSLQADLRMEISGGRLTIPQKKAGILGFEGAVVFPDLTTLRSAPRQQIAFERTYVGDLAASDGRIDFQIEPGGVFFLEQGRFQWCQGTVYLPATRVMPGKDEYDLTLSCDRLKLAPLLEQIGAARAEGGGTVSGRVPIRIRKGQFQVDSGFLYSSPGEGGTIRLRGTDMLTAGIPPGTPQFNQLELARQALKEYDYDWVKLTLATEPREDLLRLKLQLSGRPTHPLPFIYDTRAGGFVPADPESPGSRFEEIKLDVNFSLPLNRLLEYKDLLNLFS
jgi:hypothetical protein